MSLLEFYMYGQLMKMHCLAEEALLLVNFQDIVGDVWRIASRVGDA